MLTPRWRKVLSDLWSNKARTLLVALSIAVGVFAVGMVSSTYLILRQDMQEDFLSADPHEAMIYCQLFDDDFLASLRHTEGIGQIEGRSSTNGQVTIPGN